MSNMSNIGTKLQSQTITKLLWSPGWGMSSPTNYICFSIAFLILPLPTFSNLHILTFIYLFFLAYLKNPKISTNKKISYLICFHFSKLPVSLLYICLLYSVVMFQTRLTIHSQMCFKLFICQPKLSRLFLMVMFPRLLCLGWSLQQCSTQNIKTSL